MGRSHETPTANEGGYKPSGATKPNWSCACTKGVPKGRKGRQGGDTVCEVARHGKTEMWAGWQAVGSG